MKRFPRVLFVAKSLINDVDSAGAALRGWFKEWPRDHLAQVFSGAPTVGTPFCERTYQLGPAERRLGSVFFRLKGSSLADAALPYRTSGAPKNASARSGALAAVKRAAGRALVGSGLWELAFTPALSPGLRGFIEEFRPDVVFAQGADLSFMRLPLLVRGAFGTPIHFDILDDWVEHLYRSSWAAPLMRRIVRQTFRDLLAASACRYTIGEAMADAYQRRYGLPFATLMQCDDPGRFSLAPETKRRARATYDIVYSGSLALGRWKALLDLAQACVSIEHSGRPITITAYVPFVPKEAAGALSAAPRLELKAAVPDASVPGVLASADLLFLPESFERPIAEYVKLSISTKAHLYMMAGRPSLVYGPAGIGTVEYARRDGWGHVVDREGAAPLAQALELLMTDARLRQAIVDAAAKTAAKNHSGATVRESLRRMLSSSCA